MMKNSKILLINSMALVLKKRSKKKKMKIKKVLSRKKDLRE